jgi:hypothetical protein
MAPSGGGLFVDHKKGEIPEIKTALRDPAIAKVRSAASAASAAPGVALPQRRLHTATGPCPDTELLCACVPPRLPT